MSSGAQQIEQKLQDLGIVLPETPKPVASYLPCTVSGNLAFVSGQLPSQAGRIVYLGKVPTALSMEDGILAARMAVINALAVLKNVALGGDWRNFVSVVRVGVFVQSDDNFYEQPKVANGASDLLAEIFGQPGRHARAAVGVNALPLNAAVEVELTAEILRV